MLIFGSSVPAIAQMCDIREMGIVGMSSVFINLDQWYHYPRFEKTNYYSEPQHNHPTKNPIEKMK